MQDTYNAKTLAIFDLDNTLIAGDSDHAWGEYLITQKLVDPEKHRQLNDQFYSDYCNGTLDIVAYQRFALSAIAGKKRSELAELHADYLEQMIKPMMLENSLALLERHRQRGHFLLVITATNDFVARPITEMLGVDDMLGCTAALNKDVYTGEIEGTPCFQEGKIQRLEEWITQQDEHFTIEGSYFYSDSHNDIPLLERVTHPVAVDADEKLNAYAEAKGWPRISLRQ